MRETITLSLTDYDNLMEGVTKLETQNAKLREALIKCQLFFNNPALSTWPYMVNGGPNTIYYDINILLPIVQQALKEGE